MKEAYRRASGYLLYFIFAALISATTWYSIRSRPLTVFVSVLAAWLCYAGAHKQLVGEMVHTSEEKIDERGADTLRRKLGLAVGGIASFIAFPVCILAVNTMSFPLLTTGYLLFFSGYMLMHYNWFDDPI